MTPVTRLFDEYQDVNRHVVCVEIDVELATDFELGYLKKPRLGLKGEIDAILNTI